MGTNDGQSGAIVSPGLRATLLSGTTPGSVANESVELTINGAGHFSLTDGTAFTFRVQCVAGGVQSGPARVTHGFEATFVARRDSGVTTIAALGSSQDFGDSSTSDWTFTPSVGSSPDRIVLTFETGAIASACHVVATVTWSQTAY
jgi:hypothetical protein